MRQQGISGCTPIDQMLLTCLSTPPLPLSLTHTPKNIFTEEDRIAFLTPHTDQVEGIFSIQEDADTSLRATTFTSLFRVKVRAHTGTGTHSTCSISYMQLCTHARTHAHPHKAHASTCSTFDYHRRSSKQAMSLASDWKMTNHWVRFFRNPCSRCMI